MPERHLKVKSLEELNAHLKKACQDYAKKTKYPEQKDKTVFEVYGEERPELLAYRGDFESYQVKEERVSPYSFIRHETNCYSIDCPYVGQAAEVRIFARKIIVVHQGKVIDSHQRCFGRHQCIYDPWHYVPLLERKPGALRNGAPFKHWALPDALQKARERLSKYKDGDKQFVNVLLQVKVHGLEKVDQACALALSKAGCTDTLILHYLANGHNPPVSLSAPRPLIFPPTKKWMAWR